MDFLKPNQLFLAPMAGITDLAYRMVLKEFGADIVTTELISAKSFKYGSQRTRFMMKTHCAEKPVGIQLFGSETEHLCDTAKYCEDSGASFVDLNLGCPVPKVTKSGSGSAMLKDPKKLVPILKGMRESIKIPLSLKIRTGWDSDSITASEIIKIATEEGINWVSVHGRTKEQAYRGSVDWDFIKKLTLESKIPIVGNGDIITHEQAKILLNDGFANHLMIGRKLLTDPFFFLRIKKMPIPNLSKFILRYHDLAEEFTHPKTLCVKLRKIFIYLSTGWQGYQEYRKELYLCSDNSKEIRDHSLDFFAKSHLDSSYQYQNFLMGGHG